MEEAAVVAVDADGEVAVAVFDDEINAELGAPVGADPSGAGFGRGDEGDGTLGEHVTAALIEGELGDLAVLGCGEGEFDSGFGEGELAGAGLGEGELTLAGGLSEEFAFALGDGDGEADVGEGVAASDGLEVVAGEGNEGAGGFDNGGRDIEECINGGRRDCLGGGATVVGEDDDAEVAVGERAEFGAEAEPCPAVGHDLDAVDAVDEDAACVGIGCSVDADALGEAVHEFAAAEGVAVEVVRPFCEVVNGGEEPAVADGGFDAAEGEESVLAGGVTLDAAGDDGGAEVVEAGSGHAERGADAVAEVLLDGAAGDLFDGFGEEEVAGVAVDELGAWGEVEVALAFDEGEGGFIGDGDAKDVVALDEHEVEVVAQAAGVVKKLTEGDGLGVAGEIGEDGLDFGVEIEFAFEGEEVDEGGGELFADAADIEDVIGAHGDAEFHIGHAVGFGPDDLASAGDGDDATGGFGVGPGFCGGCLDGAEIGWVESRGSGWGCESDQNEGV